MTTCQKVSITITLILMIISMACLAGKPAPTTTPIETPPSPQTKQPLSAEGSSPSTTTTPLSSSSTTARSLPITKLGPVSLDDYRIVKIAGGFDQPLYLTHAGDGSGRVFIVEQKGVIWVLDEDFNRIPEPFLDITSIVKDGGERGLLGLAFHPKYKMNGLLFVHYTDKSGDTTVSRFRVSADPNKVDEESEEVLLTLDQPYGNHNGGQLSFGPEGYLYIGLGDGGSGGDPENNSQNPKTLLGAILRIDVDHGALYSIPRDNPFAENGAGRPEVWVYGLRNPWRFSFDRVNGGLFIGDVGQDRWEEVDYLEANAKGGVNYGWNQMEGEHCYKEGCDLESYKPPIAEYSHEEGCSVTGGYVYRGDADDPLYGSYIYGDYCSGRTWALSRDKDGRWKNSPFLETDLRISSFGEDEAGGLYVIDHRGGVYRTGDAKNLRGFFAQGALRNLTP